MTARAVTELSRVTNLTVTAGEVLTRYSQENLVSWLQVHFIKFHTCILKGLITVHEIKLGKVKPRFVTRCAQAIVNKEPSTARDSNNAMPSAAPSRGFVPAPT
ncbi:uncharacterized protein G2W53_030573 [Senna tora]|uniref:Uncharacterized protein n=1 Tax=Senna tora TaxID=362788 RepID=A0A834WGW6_9FABA|nr:uncharacterized protein G2W53_030573 [Senna tora]